MAASQHTTNYNLPIYQPRDIPQYLGDEDSWNSTMRKIDTAIHEAAQSGGGGGGDIAQTTGNSTTAVMSQNATTVALTNKVDTTSIVQEINTSTPSATNIPSEAAVAAALESSSPILFTSNASSISLTTTAQTIGTLTDVNPGTFLVLLTTDLDMSAQTNPRELVFSIHKTGKGSLGKVYSIPVPATNAAHQIMLSQVYTLTTPSSLDLKLRKNGDTGTFTISDTNIILIKIN